MIRHHVDPPARASLEARRSEAACGIAEAMTCIQQVLPLGSRLRQSLCGVQGMIPERTTLAAIADRVTRSGPHIHPKADRQRGEPPLMDAPPPGAGRHGTVGPASKRPMDAAAADAGMDGPPKVPRRDRRPHPLGRRQADAGAHKPLGKAAKRPAVFPQRPQGPAQQALRFATMSRDQAISGLAPRDGER